MNKLLLYCIICFFLAGFTLMLPYVEKGSSTTVLGYMEDMVLVQFIIYVIITGISSFKQNAATAIIGLVFCFSFFLYFVLLDFVLTFEMFYEAHLRIGYFIALGLAVIFMLLHILNLIVVIRKMKTKSKEADELIDSF